MSIYSPPPPLQSWQQVKPTLLVCWWTTLFSITIILLRVVGRFVRTERLLTEDRVVAAALVPMLLRIGCVHLVLSHGTNNANLAAANPPLSSDDLHLRSIASGLVLLSRILYAATLWTLKAASLHFFSRVTSHSWTRSYETTLLIMRATLAFTFVAIVISTLSECQPFDHYWQVLPDPGPRCRQGFAQLLTAGSSSVLTDLLLVVFPVPFAMQSTLRLGRKAQLVLLFSFSLLPVAVTAYRVPSVIAAAGDQTIRSLLASIEILVATAAANSLVLGSFVRDIGPKKARFDISASLDSAAQNLHHSSRENSKASTALDDTADLIAPSPLLARTFSRYDRNLRHWGSDQSLVRDLGISVARHLREDPNEPVHPDDMPLVRFTSPALASSPCFVEAAIASPCSAVSPSGLVSFGPGQPSASHSNDRKISINTNLQNPAFSDANFATPIHSPATIASQRVSLYDIGRLLDHPAQEPTSPLNSTSPT